MYQENNPIKTLLTDWTGWSPKAYFYCAPILFNESSALGNHIEPKFKSEVTNHRSQMRWLPVAEMQVETTLGMVMPWLTRGSRELAEQRSLWPEICLNLALNLILFSCVLICEEVEKEVLWLNASRRQILQKLHIQLLAVCGASDPWEEAGLGGEQEQPQPRALDTSLGMGSDWGQSRTSTLTSAGPHCCCCGTGWHPLSFHSCQDFIIKVGTSALFHSGN